MMLKNEQLRALIERHNEAKQTLEDVGGELRALLMPIKAALDGRDLHDYRGQRVTTVWDYSEDIEFAVDWDYCGGGSDHYRVPIRILNEADPLAAAKAHRAGRDETKRREQETRDREELARLRAKLGE